LLFFLLLGFVALVALLEAALSFAAFQQVGTAESERLRNQFNQSSMDRVLALERPDIILLDVMMPVVWKPR
ncbi:MAG: hypothetical protein IIB30_05495, partial [Chloroflexi bacterium]|nr:hypothetical protein [Chloroflexota bacterium]